MPLTLTNFAVNSAGNQISGTFNSSGVDDGNGNTSDQGDQGFAVSGAGSSAVSSWSISGVTLTLVVTPRIQSGATVTLSFVPGLPGFENTADETLDEFSSAAVTNNSSYTPSRMKALHEAIKTWYDASGLSSTFTGGVYLDGVAKDGAAFPFLVMNVIAAPVTESYGPARHSYVAVQFRTFQEGTSIDGAMRRALTALETFVTAFDSASLTISSGGRHIDHYRENEPIPVMQSEGEPGVVRSQSGNKVCGAAVTYQIAVQ